MQLNDVEIKHSSLQLGHLNITGIFVLAIVIATKLVSNMYLFTGALS